MQIVWTCNIRYYLVEFRSSKLEIKIQGTLKDPQQYSEAALNFLPEAWPRGGWGDAGHRPGPHGQAPGA
jgi:hypothetical protein